MATLEALVARIDERTEWIVCELKKSREKDGEFFTRIGSLERFRARVKGMAKAVAVIAGVVGTVIALLLAACATPAYVTRARPDNEIEVRIVDDNWLQARVYGIYSNGRPERLTFTDLHGTQTTLNASRMNSGFRFKVVLFASGETWYSENVFWARPGDCIEVRVKPMLSTSYVMPCGL